MNLTLPILFLFCFVLGILFNFELFKQDKNHTQSTKFISSERFLAFAIEIMIALIGFGVTLAITNQYERQMDKKQAAHMIEQVIEFTDRQLGREKSYLNMYKKETITATGLKVSNVISLEYYNNVMSSDVVLQNANMNTYGDIMTYLIWIGQRDELAKDAEDGKVYSYMVQRYNHLKTLRELLVVCHEELTGVITAEEAKQMSYEIRHPETESNSSAAATS